MPEDRTVLLPDGESVAVRYWGGTGPPVLLLHGFLGTAEEWGDLPRRLGPGYRVAVLDLPGHGRSAGAPEPARYLVPRVARDLELVQQALFGEPAWWIGYSMGGRVALAAAAEGVPMRGLLLESASPGIRDSGGRAARRRQDEARARRLEEEGTEAFVEEWLTLPLFDGLARRSPEVREEARRVRAGQDPARMAAWLRGGGTGSQPSYWESLASLSLPVRLLVGERDEGFLAVAREMCGLLADATLTVAPGVGHVPHLEAPGVWLTWVEQALGSP